MSFVTVTCPSCGSVDAGIERASLHMSLHRSTSVCVVHCPVCGGRIERGVNHTMAAALRAVGVAAARAETRRWEATSLIDEEELADFCQRLASTDEVVGWLTAPELAP